MNGSSRSSSPFSRGPSGRLLVVLATSSMVLWTGLFIVSPLLPSIITELSISPARAGLAVSVMWLLVALCRYPGGVVADQLSRKTALVGAYALTIAGFLVLVQTTSYGQLIAGLVFVGVGAGVYMPASVALLSDLFADRRGQVFGIHELFIDFGGFLAGMLTVGVLGIAAWNRAFLPIVVSLGIIALVMHRARVDSYVVGPISFDARGTVTRLAGVRRVRWTLVAFALFTFVWQGVTSFLPTVLQFEKGFSPTFASHAFAGLFLVGMATNLIVPPLSDRFGHTRVAVGVIVVCAGGVGLLVVGQSKPTILMGIGLFSTGLSLWAIMTAYLISLLVDTKVGAEYGAVTTISSVFGSLGPTFVGSVALGFSYSLAYLCLAGMLLGAGVALTLSATD